MLFEPNFNKIVSSVKKNLGTVQTVVELKMPTNEASIDRVFSCNAKAYLNTYEVVGSTISFTGAIDFKCIYEAGEILATNYVADFKDKLEYSEEIVGEVVLSVNVLDVTSTPVANGIKVTAIVEVSASVITSKTLDVLVSMNADNCYDTTKELNYSSFNGIAHEKFEVTKDIDMFNAAKVLNVDSTITHIFAEPKNNYIAVSGKICCNISYIKRDSNKLTTTSENVDFDWEVAYDGDDSDSFVESKLNIILPDVKVTSVAEEDGVLLSLFIPIDYKGYIFRSTKQDIVDDVYLEDNYMSVTSENVVTMINGKDISIKENIGGSVEISETAPFIDDIVGVVMGEVTLASGDIDSKNLSLMGVASASVIYYTKETDNLTSVQVEMPFNIEESVDADKLSMVHLSMCDLSAKSRRGKEIDVVADLCAYVSMYDERENSVISEISLGDTKPKDDCALYIYIVKPGDSLWSIAKDMNTSVEHILEQNPDISEALIPGQRIVVYKPRLMNF